jgi:hypothetical protein
MNCSLHAAQCRLTISANNTIELKLARLLPASARSAEMSYDKLKLNWRSVPEIDPSIPAFVELPHALPFTIPIYSLIWIQRRKIMALLLASASRRIKLPLTRCKYISGVSYLINFRNPDSSCYEASYVRSNSFSSIVCQFHVSNLS